MVQSVWKQLRCTEQSISKWSHTREIYIVDPQEKNHTSQNGQKRLQKCPRSIVLDNIDGNDNAIEAIRSCRNAWVDVIDELILAHAVEGLWILPQPLVNVLDQNMRVCDLFDLCAPTHEVWETISNFCGYVVARRCRRCKHPWHVKMAVETCSRTATVLFLYNNIVVLEHRISRSATCVLCHASGQCIYHSYICYTSGRNPTKQPCRGSPPSIMYTLYHVYKAMCSVFATYYEQFWPTRKALMRCRDLLFSAAT